MIYWVIPTEQMASTADRLTEGYPALHAQLRLVDYGQLATMPEYPCGLWVFGSATGLLEDQRRVAAYVEARILSARDGFAAANRPSLARPRIDVLLAIEAAGLPVAPFLPASALPVGARFPLVLRWEAAEGSFQSSVVLSEAELAEAYGSMLLAGYDPERTFASFLDEDAMGLPDLVSALRIGPTALVSDALSPTWDAAVDEDGKSLGQAMVAALDVFGLDFVRLDFASVGGRLRLWHFEDGPGLLPRNLPYQANPSLAVNWAEDVRRALTAMSPRAGRERAISSELDWTSLPSSVART